MRLVPVSERLVHFLELLQLFLGDFVVVEDLDVLLGDALDLALLILAEVLGRELVDWVVKDEDLVALLGVLLQDGASEDGVFGVTGQVKNGVLVVLHAADVLVERDKTVGLGRRVEPKSGNGTLV